MKHKFFGKITKYGTVVAGIVSVLGIACTGCSSVNDGELPEDAPYVVVIAHDTTNAYWDSIFLGAEDAAAELDYRLECMNLETSYNVEEQLECIDKAVKAGADAIVIGPLHDEKIEDKMESLVDQGIIVVSFDENSTNEACHCNVGTDNVTAGAVAGRWIAESLEGEGDVFLLADDDYDVYAERIQGFNDQIEGLSSERFTHLDIKDVQIGDGSVETAKALTIEFLSSHHEAKYIFTTGSISAEGAIQAVEELRLRNSVGIIAFDNTEANRSYLEDGRLDGLIVERPFSMGYLGVRYVSKVMNGEFVDDFIDTGVVLINQETLYDEDVQALLYPEIYGR